MHVYNALDPNVKFNTIYWNTPFGYVNENEQLTDYEKAVFDPGYKATKRFILEARSHLVPDGQVLLGFSSTLGNQEALMAMAEEAGLTFELVNRELEKDNPNAVWLEFYRGTFNS